MSSIGPNSPGTTADDATVGTVSWSNPNNAQASDAVYATALDNAGADQTTHYLKATNYGFTVPSTAIINGIYVRIQRKADSSSSPANVRDSTVKIVKSDGSFGSINKADTITRWPLLENYQSYGSATDLWGETWSASDINNSNFGVATSVVLHTGSSITASIDYISISVYYLSKITGLSSVTGIQSITF